MDYMLVSIMLVEIIQWDKYTRYNRTLVIDRSSLERDRSTHYRSTSAIGSGPNIIALLLGYSLKWRKFCENSEREQNV